VNVVCRAVLQGAPAAARGRYTAAAIKHYANRAMPAANRAAVSLSRLAAHGDGPVLAALARAYTSLQALYAAAGTAGAGDRATNSLAQEIRAHDRALGAIARSDGLPACAVTGS
jgi:hypothetical protein